MALLFLDEVYNGNNFLSANVGDWVTAEAKFMHYVNFDNSVITSSLIIHAVSSTYWVELLDGSDWSDYGFADGKSVNFANHNLSTSSVNNVTSTVDYLDGNLMFLTSYPSTMGVGQFPMNNSSGVLDKWFEISQTSAPEKLEFDFNLTSTTSLDSVIDGNINRFKVDNVNTMSVTNTIDMTQINSKSGGLIEDVELTLDYESAGGHRKYTVSYKFLNWAFIQDGDNAPTWFDGVDTVAPINRVRVYSELNNPNLVMEATSSNTNANCGGFNENYNTGIENYTFESLVLKDLVGTVVDSIDYCNTTKFEAVINAPAGQLDTVRSRFNIGMTWIPQDTAEYQNKITNLGDNLAVLAPKFDFPHSPTPSITQYNGYNNTAHSIQWSFKNVHFEIVGDTVIVKGDVFPTNNNSYFSTLSLGELKHTMWVSCWRDDVANNQRKKSSTKIFDEDVICNPELGKDLRFPVFLYDHDNYVVSTTTTEDDVRFLTEIILEQNVNYEYISAGLKMVNSVTDESFDLEKFVFNFVNVPYVNGKYEVNETIPRNFNLPPTTDRNDITLSRVPAQDEGVFYRLNLDYGFENDWRYWLSQANASLDFFNNANYQNGLNKDWQKYTQNADWTMKMELLINKGVVTDYQTNTIGINDYEFEDVTETTTLINLTDNTTPSSFIENTEMEVTTLLTWNTGIYDADSVWAEVTIEDFESGNRWVLSSVLPQGFISSNPLKSVIASDKLDVQIALNVATLKYKIDTTQIDVNKVSITSRIFSSSFRDRVIAGGGTYEANQCLVNIIEEIK